MVPTVTFTDLLQQALSHKGMTAVELATALAVAEETVHRWLHGEHEPQGKHRQLLADCLGVEVFKLWPPESIADKLTSPQARLLLNAHKRGDTAVIHVAGPTEQQVCRALAALWLVERSGRDTFTLTLHGMDVRDALLAS